MHQIIAVKHHDQSNLRKREFILASGSRGLELLTCSNMAL